LNWIAIKTKENEGWVSLALSAARFYYTIEDLEDTILKPFSLKELFLCQSQKLKN
jgi:hypothetical protein